MRYLSPYSLQFSRLAMLVPLAVFGAGLLLVGHREHSLHGADFQPGRPLNLVLRDRQPASDKSGRYELRRRPRQWDPKKTALIICDMWDLHHCKRAVDRVLEMASRMNAVISRARNQGVFIIHAPSSCMAPYEGTLMRQRAKSAARAANLPNDIAGWCTRIPSEEKGRYPIDQSDGGEDDEVDEHAQWVAKLMALGRDPKKPWKSQLDLLRMEDQDAVSDSGVEIWNLLEERGIQNVLLMGVHTNMCVLGRPFGLRQMAKNGKNVALVRDLTDTMYNPARWPYVNHFRGTDLVVEHVEKFVCPTVTSDQILGDGKPFRFRDNLPARVVLAISENEYKTHQTLPVFAAEVLRDTYGLEPIVLHGDPNDPHRIPGLADALAKADGLILSMRRRAMPESDMVAVRDFLDRGKPLVGIRTASHAFHAHGQGPKGYVEWRTFDPDVLGGHYTGHYGAGPKTLVKLIPGADHHPIASGLPAEFRGNGSLYKVRPLAASTAPLLMGSIPGKEPEPVAWTNAYGKARVFYTSLGHPDDFRDPSFVRLLGNAVLWSLEGR